MTTRASPWRSSGSASTRTWRTLRPGLRYAADSDSTTGGAQLRDPGSPYPALPPTRLPLAKNTMLLALLCAIWIECVPRVSASERLNSSLYHPTARAPGCDRYQLSGKVTGFQGDASDGTTRACVALSGGRRAESKMK